MFKPDYRLDRTKEKIADVLRESGLLSAQSFVNLIYDDVRSHQRGEFHSENILAAARKYDVPADEEMWSEVFSDFPEYDTLATRSILLTKAQLPINKTTLSAALHDVVRDNPGSLALQPEAYAKQQQINQRRMWINAITESGKHATYPIWAAQHGQFRWIQCESLEHEDDAMLEALASKVPGWRRQIASGRQKVETSPQTDSLGELNTKPERIEMENDEFLAHPQHPERELTISEAKSRLRELLFLPNSSQSRGPRRVAALNRLLSGRKFGE